MFVCPVQKPLADFLVGRPTKGKLNSDRKPNSGSKAKPKKMALSEVKVEVTPKLGRSIELNWRAVELKIDAGFPLESLVELVRKLGTAR